MIGVVLAAGNATRLPNKLLLPMHHCKPLILSGVEYLRANDVREIRVVVSPDSAVELFLDRYYLGRYGIKCVTQTEPNGVVDAIMHGIRDCDPPREKVTVVCGDNIYPAGEMIPLLDPPFVVSRVVQGGRAKHLVQWNPEVRCWDRPGKPYVDPLCLTTPWVFTVEMLRRVADGRIHMDRMEEMLNFFSVGPTEMPSAGWWDIGTPDTFQEYWRS